MLDYATRLYMAANALGCVMVALGTNGLPVLLVPGIAAAGLGQASIAIAAIRHG